MGWEAAIWVWTEPALQNRTARQSQELGLDGLFLEHGCELGQQVESVHGLA